MVIIGSKDIFGETFVWGDGDVLRLCISEWKYMSVLGVQAGSDDFFVNDPARLVFILFAASLDWLGEFQGTLLAGIFIFTRVHTDSSLLISMVALCSRRIP